VWGRGKRAGAVVVLHLKLSSRELHLERSRENEERAIESTHSRA